MCQNVLGSGKTGEPKGSWMWMQSFTKAVTQAQDRTRNPNALSQQCYLPLCHPEQISREQHLTAKVVHNK